MNKLQLFFLLRKNAKLSEKRHPMFEANQYGKFFGYLGIAIVAVEFIAIGTFMGWAAVKEAVPEMMLYTMPFLLMVGFFMRFMMQQTPMMLVKPYLLTPVSKYTAIDCFLIKQLLDLGNLFWMTIFLPYVFIVWRGGIRDLPRDLPLQRQIYRDTGAAPVPGHQVHEIRVGHPSGHAVPAASDDSCQ